MSTLPGGLRVATAEMPHMAGTSAGLWAGVGGRNEPARFSGIAHFIEHLLFKGTGKRDARQITAEVEGAGGYLNAFTSEDHTCYYAKAPAVHLPRLLDVLSDMMLDSVFDPREIEREREVIREEILMYRDQPQHHVQELLNEALWPDQALGRPLTGTVETIGRMTRNDFMAFLGRNYHARTVVLTVAGRVTHEEVLRLAAPIAARFRSGRPPSALPAEIRSGGPRVRVAVEDVEQLQLALAWPAIGRRDPRRFALKLLCVLLGENMSSRLFQILRERHGLCYSVQTGTSSFHDTGAFHFSAGLDPSNLGRALRLVLRELNRIRETPPGRRELTQVRDYAVGQLHLGLESTSSRMVWLGESILAYGRVIDPHEVENSLVAVTEDQVRAVARDIFRPSRMAAAAVGPGADAAQLRRFLTV